MKLKVSRVDVWAAGIKGRPGRLAAATGKRLIAYLALDAEEAAAGWRPHKGSADWRVSDKAGSTCV